ncbi:MAG: molybdopterin-dependent oxidoreductase [Alphaproteobacteria bacterium]|nr:molybdopterin-dependent oxidoreductase [Alphaproteobacteria bacterium]
MSSDLSFELGAPVPRVEDERLLIGGGQFLDDRAFPDMVHAAVVRSPHPHARIMKIDITVAQVIPGVLLILTGEDYAAAGLGSIPCQDACETRDGMPRPDLPFPALARKRVLYVGEAVAFVVAESDVIARDAAELVEVKYDPLPSNTDLDKAGDTPVLWPQCLENEVFYATQGDAQSTDRAFADAAHIVHQRLVNQRISANPLEVRGYIGCFEGGKYKLLGGVHSPHLFRTQLTRDVFHINEDQLRIVTGDVGGSFGMRGALFPEIILVLWASQKLGRPVKWLASRTESFVSDHHGRDVISDAELALNGAGKFLGLRVAIKANIGAYLSIKGPRSALNALTLQAGCYKIAACDVNASGIMTNTVPTAPYRGAGGPEAAYILERLIDKAAIETGFDRVEIRRRNLISTADMPYDTGLGLTYDCGEFEAVMDQALALADISGFEERRAASLIAGKRRGIGVCNVLEQTGRPSIEGADLRIDAEGRVTLAVGTAPQGQGHETIFKQLICEALGVMPEQVAVVTGDTVATNVGGGTFNSRSAVCGGAAVEIVKQKIIERCRNLAADQFEAAVEDIEFSSGQFQITGTDRCISLIDVAIAEGGVGEAAEFSPDTPTFPQGCHICEVEIDSDTGIVSVERYVTVDDVGTVLNPLTLEGQIHGGVVQGIGQALLEEIHYDPASGQILSGSFMDYAMPRADDICSFASGSHPVPTKTNSLGVKGAGEAGTVGALPAVMCAVADALADIGGRDIDMPATPERVWQVIAKGR